MRLPELQREPCEVHAFQPHAHLWHLPAYAKRECPGRFWCPRCKRWIGGEKCKPGAKAAGR